MIFTFTVISDEVDDFVREIRIDGNATFQDLHKTILSTCGYPDDQMTSFFICSERWEKEQEITLEDMGNTNADEDSYVMRNTRLDELLEDEGQRLIYIFDPMAERCLFMELTQVEFSKNLKAPKITRKSGEAPKQLVDFDDAMKNMGGSMDLDENFYGSEDFSEDEFDPEGFEFTDGNPFED